MRCDQCKHWQVGIGDAIADRVGFGICNRMHAGWSYGDNIDGLRAQRAYVQDADETEAELFTGPDFFCALFETR